MHGKRAAAEVATPPSLGRSHPPWLFPRPAVLTINPGLDVRWALPRSGSLRTPGFRAEVTKCPCSVLRSMFHLSVPDRPSELRDHLRMLCGVSGERMPGRVEQKRERFSPATAAPMSSVGYLATDTSSGVGPDSRGYVGQQSSW